MIEFTKVLNLVYPHCLRLVSLGFAILQVCGGQGT